MFQASDSTSKAPPTRQQWMALLARAPVDLLEPALGAHASAAPQWLRVPETGLMMVQGRAGGTGERFNLGEVTVTRCALRLPAAGLGHAAVGVGYVMGRSHRHARLAAIADAMLQDPAQHAALDAALLEPVRSHLAQRRAERQARAQSTKVEFFTVARESGGIEDDEENNA
jgi:alpha-D-ribose 1-methylphosphonate 5-triphosphate synthase subunit PhnG